MRILPVLQTLLLSVVLCPVCIAHAADDVHTEDSLDLNIQDLVKACTDMWAREVKQETWGQRQAVSRALLTSARDMTAWMRKYHENIEQADLDHDTQKATTFAYTMLADAAGDIGTGVVLRVGNAVANAREAYVFHGFSRNAARFMTAFVLLRLTDEVKLHMPEHEMSVSANWPVMFSVLPESERAAFVERVSRIKENKENGKYRRVDMSNAVASYMYVDGKRVPMQGIPDMH